jgi:hypothetical protein
MSTIESDEPLCEYRGCDKPGWVVLCFGPKKTPPLRIACTVHQHIVNLALFRDRKKATS